MEGGSEVITRNDLGLNLQGGTKQDTDGELPSALPSQGI